MIQLKVYDSPLKLEQYWIDLYESSPIKLNISIEDIQNVETRSVFSRTFRVPGTRNNAEFFKNLFDVNDTLFDITVKKPAEILVDGAEFKTGHIRLQKIYINKSDDKIDYELLFLGETRDFSSLLGDLTLAQLDLQDIAGNNSGLTLTGLDIIESWNAYDGVGPIHTGGLHGGDIVYPLIDHGNLYENGVIQDTRIAVTGANNFTNVDLNVNRFLPIIRIKRIWDQIFSNTNYTYQSSLLGTNSTIPELILKYPISERFQHMYISAFGNSAETNTWDANTTGGIDSINNGIITGLVTPLGPQMMGGSNRFGVTQIEGGDYDGLDITSYNISTIGMYKIRSVCSVNAVAFDYNYFSNPVDVRIELWNLDRLALGLSYLVAAGDYRGDGELQLDVTLTTGFAGPGGAPIDVGDNLGIFVLTSPSANPVGQVTRCTFEIYSSPGQFNPVASCDNTYKQIDFVKDILTTFRLVLAPDPIIPFHFIIEPWQDYINSGKVHDWSNKLVEDRDMPIEPIFLSQSQIINFNFANGGDYLNDYHQKAYSQPYGQLKFSSNNDLLTGTKEIKVAGIEPTEIMTIEGSDPTDNFTIAQLHAHGDVDSLGEVQHVPIKAKTRLLFYNGTHAIVNPDFHWKLDGVPVDQSEYPLVSPYEYWPITESSLNLNFANDVQYWGQSSGYNKIGVNLFSAYWSRYISNIYGKFTRRLTGYFILNNIDLTNLQFSDTIFVNGVYYRPESIVDFEIGEYQAVQVNLITSNDYRPRVVVNEALETLTATGMAASCIANGYIDVEVDGTPGYSWILSNGMSGIALENVTPTTPPYTFQIPDITPGTYGLDITDVLGRTGSTEVIVPEFIIPTITASHTVTPATDCFAPCNGVILTLAAGGTAPYSTVWSDGIIANARYNVCPGEYTYYVRDVNGCRSQTYPVTMTCDFAGYIYEMRELAGDCTGPTINVVYVTSPTLIDMGLIYTLSTLPGCYEVLANVTDTPTTSAILDSYATCETCYDVPSPAYIETSGSGLLYAEAFQAGAGSAIDDTEYTLDVYGGDIEVINVTEYDITLYPGSSAVGNSIIDIVNNATGLLVGPSLDTDLSTTDEFTNETVQSIDFRTLAPGQYTVAPAAETTIISAFPGAPDYSTVRVSAYWRIAGSTDPWVEIN